MLMSEIKNADPELLITMIRQVLKKQELPVWVRFVDDRVVTAPVIDVDPQEHDLFLYITYEGEGQWFDLNPSKEWTISKERIGWVIHAVE
jgi:hypothetical protein